MWIGTNPATRKVADLARDPRATLQFFERPFPAYVTLVGTAAVVADPEVKAVHFKEEWGPFFKDRFRGAGLRAPQVRSAPPRDRQPGARARERSEELAARHARLPGKPAP